MSRALSRRYRKLVRYLDWRHRKRERIARRLQIAFYADFWTEPALDCGATIEKLGLGYLRLSRGQAHTIVNGPLVMLDTHLTCRLMGNKPVTYRLLRDLGVSVPGHAVFHWKDERPATAFFDSLGGPVVVKPAHGTGAGAGVTTGIMTRRQLTRAIATAAAYCDELLVERQLQGRSYRLLYLDYELIDAVERQPPSVTGDGRKSIRALIDDENARRAAARPPIATSLLAQDDELRGTLAEQGLSLGSVPAAGRRIAVKRVINQNNRFENVRVTSQVHASVRQRCAEICRALGVRLAGVDLIGADVSRPWSDETVVNEINTTPGLHHHYLVKEPCEPDLVAPRILETLLAEQHATSYSRQAYR